MATRDRTPVPRPERLVNRSSADGADRAKLRRLLAFHGFDAKGEPLSEKIGAFQEVSGLDPSGRLDTATLAALNARRCCHPVRALPPTEEAARFEASAFTPAIVPANLDQQVPPEIYVDTDVGADHEYELIRARWSRRTLHFCLIGAPPGDLQSRGWDAVRRALATWQKVGVVSLIEKSDPAAAEIRVLWTPGPALDPTSKDPFYGPGEYVAVGYYPFPQFGELAGDLHFDQAEAWTVDSDAGGLDLETVALHEIGHCLGLGHSRNEASVMWPTYKPLQRQLIAADRAEIARQYKDAPA